MSASYRDEQAGTLHRAARGSGSVRERRAGVWEIRVVVAFDAGRGRSVQKSFTVHGDHVVAARRRHELVAAFGCSRVECSATVATLSVGDLLDRYLAAPHGWAPASLASARTVVRALVADPLAAQRLVTLAPSVVQAAILRWQRAGASVATVSGRWLVLRAALSWACGEGLLRVNPLAGMRGPPRPAPRRHHSMTEVRQLLRAARWRVADAERDLGCAPSSQLALARLFAAEQDLLLVRLAADSGARRGELAVLRHADLDGCVLTIERGLSDGVIGPTKQRRARRLTLTTSTAAMVDHHMARWADWGPPPLGDWLFAPTPLRARFLTSGALSHRFSRLGVAAGVDRPALHRLRHGLATHLVDEGKILKAQARLGHADPATTLRHYSHAIPLDDQDVADELEILLAADE